MLELKARPMREHDYTTLFKLAHMLKDLRLCLEEAEAVGQGSSFVERDGESSWRRPTPQGYGEQDFAALLEALEERSARGSRRVSAAAGGPGSRQRAAARAAHEIHDHGREQHRQRRGPGRAPKIA